MTVTKKERDCFFKKIWLNQVDMLWNQDKLGSRLSQNNLILED